jgi:hypothetical protein
LKIIAQAPGLAVLLRLLVERGCRLPHRSFRAGFTAGLPVLSPSLPADAPERVYSLVKGMVRKALRPRRAFPTETHADSLAQAESCYLRTANLAREIGYSRGRIAALHSIATVVYLHRGQFDLPLVLHN